MSRCRACGTPLVDPRFIRCPECRLDGRSPVPLLPERNGRKTLLAEVAAWVILTGLVALVTALILAA